MRCAPFSNSPLSASPTPTCSRRARATSMPSARCGSPLRSTRSRRSGQCGSSSRHFPRRWTRSSTSRSSGSKQVVWGNRILLGNSAYINMFAWKDSVRWGKNLDSMVWGECDSDGCDNVVWGNSDNVVWGNNVVWATRTTWSGAIATADELRQRRLGQLRRRWLRQRRLGQLRRRRVQQRRVGQLRQRGLGQQRRVGRQRRLGQLGQRGLGQLRWRRLRQRRVGKHALAGRRIGARLLGLQHRLGFLAVRLGRR